MQGEKKVKSLKLIDRDLLTQIYYLSQNRGCCFAGNAYFAQFLGVSEGTIKRSLKKLEDLKLIKRQHSWHQRLIYCLFDQDARLKPGPQAKTQLKARPKPNQQPGPQTSSKIPSNAWTKEGLIAAGKCFERWKKRINA